MILTKPTDIIDASRSTTWADIVFVSLEDWDVIWRRNQAIVSRLAQRFPAHRILWVERPVNVSHSVSHGRIAALREAQASRSALRSPAGLPNVLILKPIKWMPNRSGFGRKLNRRMERDAILRAMRTLRIERPLLWVNAHYAAHLVGALGARGLIYDVTDDWTAFPDLGPVLDQVIADDASLARAADATIVCSRRLWEVESRYTDRLYTVPNGVDLDHYRAAHESAIESPAFTRTWHAPVLGYAGTLHANRLDVDLVCEIAKAHASGTVALVGPNHLTASDKRRLTAFPNVDIAGPVPHNDLPAVMRHFDVCIAPHLRSDFVESLNPIKLFEYLATGKPIVATDVAGFRDYPGLVRIASTVAQFMQAVKESLAEDAALREARIVEATHNGWESRADSIVAVIKKVLDRKC